MRLAAILVLLAALAASAAQAQPCQFRGGPTHAGAYDEAAGDLSILRWRFDAGAPVVGGVVPCRQVLYVPSRSGMLFALDKRSGEPIWSFRADAPLSATPAIDGDLVFIQSDRNAVYAIRRGKVVWRVSGGPPLPFVNVDPRADLWDYWASSPLLFDGVLYIGQADGGVLALEARTGRRLWRYQTAGRVRATPATDGRTVFVGSFDGAMYALDRKTGVLRWKFQTLGNDYFKVGAIQSSAAVADGKVIFGSRDYRLYALDAAAGTLVWRLQHKDSWIVTSPAIDAGQVCVGSSDGKFVQCAKFDTGDEIWRYDMGANVFASPVLAAGDLYAASAGGLLITFDAGTRKPTGGTVFDDRVLSTPSLSEGVLYVGASNGFVYAFSGKPG